MTKRRRKPITRTETVEEFLAKGKGIQVLPTVGRPMRLLYASGHFSPKKSTKGVQPRQMSKTFNRCDGCYCFPNKAEKCCLCECHQK